MSIGYPDDQAEPNAIGVPIADQSAFSLVTGAPFTAAGFVANYQSSRIRVVPSGSAIGASVTVAYFSDETLTDQLGSYAWAIAPTGALACIVPNLGPYAQITVSTVSAVANNTAIQFTPMTAPCASARYLPVANSANALNVSVPASGNTTITMPFIAEGPGYWYFSERGGTALLVPVVWELSENGSRIFQVDQARAGTAVVNRQIYGSPRILQIQVTNTDGAAAHSFDARITLDGR